MTQQLPPSPPPPSPTLSHENDESEQVVVPTKEEEEPPRKKLKPTRSRKVVPSVVWNTLTPGMGLKADEEGRIYIQFDETILILNKKKNELTLPVNIFFRFANFNFDPVMKLRVEKETTYSICDFANHQITIDKDKNLFMLLPRIYVKKNCCYFGRDTDKLYLEFYHNDNLITPSIKRDKRLHHVNSHMCPLLESAPPLIRTRVQIYKEGCPCKRAQSDLEEEEEEENNDGTQNAKSSEN